jgi:DNA-binding NarL/FixJ family response regulator
MNRGQIMLMGGQRLNPPRVLLADDHQAQLEAEIALLLPYFDVVGTAADGAALVSQAFRLNPDVIVTDISMPILNGIDAVSKLRASGSTAKFIFVTVHSEGEFAEACTEAGALGYVHKSCMNHHLVHAINSALAGRSYASQFANMIRRHVDEESGDALGQAATQAPQPMQAAASMARSAPVTNARF